MKALLGVAGLLGLIALAFGEAAAATLARFLVYLALIAAGLLAADIMTRGAISRWIVGY